MNKEELDDLVSLSHFKTVYNYKKEIWYHSYVIKCSYEADFEYYLTYYPDNDFIQITNGKFYDMNVTLLSAHISDINLLRQLLPILRYE